VRAFERRCGSDCAIYFPQPPAAGRSFWPAPAGGGGARPGPDAEEGDGREAELQRLFPAPSLGLQAASLWGKIKDQSVGAWRATRGKVAEVQIGARLAEAFPQPRAPPAPEDREMVPLAPGSLASAAAVEVGII